MLVTLGLSQICRKFECIDDGNELQNWLLTQTYLWIPAEVGQYAAVHIHCHAETLPLQVLYFWEDKAYNHRSDHSCSSYKLNEKHSFNTELDSDLKYFMSFHRDLQDTGL